MRVTATIQVYDESAQALYKVALPEIKQGNKERTQTDISYTKDTKNNKNKVIFNIEAQDPTAFKAVSNTIIKIITVFDKMKKI
jgi:tRNA threonylcarbamoyladenosine modification (KEOPS) complex  Pcc1 subunit